MILFIHMYNNIWDKSITQHVDWPPRQEEAKWTSIPQCIQGWRFTFQHGRNGQPKRGPEGRANGRKGQPESDAQRPLPDLIGPSKTKLSIKVPCLWALVSSP